MLAYAGYQGGDLFFSGMFESRELATEKCKEYMRANGYRHNFHIVRVDSLPAPTYFHETSGAPAIFEKLED